MPLKYLVCQDGSKHEVDYCLHECKDRCMTLPTLYEITKERVWTGEPSTTQLLNGIMLEFLKITRDYSIDPQNKAFALLGTRHHSQLDNRAKELNLLSEIALSPDGHNIFDLLEPEDGSWTLTDYKTWGSYRVARALGIVAVKVSSPTGERYQKSGKWGQAGSLKQVMVYTSNPTQADVEELKLQLNRYRVMLEEKGLKIGKMQCQITVRDGGLAVARDRGITKNIYLIPVDRMENEEVRHYFYLKRKYLLDALTIHKDNPEYLPIPCNNKESWDGRRCKEYCEVFEFCPNGMLIAGVK